MNPHRRSCLHPSLGLLWLVCISCFLLVSCERPDPEVTIVAPTLAIVAPPTPPVTLHPADGSAPPTPVRPVAEATLPTYTGTPTPDPPHVILTENGEPYQVHYVNAGETLGYLAQLYNSTVEELQESNHLGEADLLYVGQELLIPRQVEFASPSFKIIPDSELVYGPAAKDFDVLGFAAQFNGFLMSYAEDVEGQRLSGPEIVDLAAKRYSVNPRLLLAILEYRAGWVTRPDAADNGFPLGHNNGSGLYLQLGWAANELNWGYYGRAEAGITSFLVSDGTRVAFAADINHGTAGVQSFLAANDSATYDDWLQEVGPDGLFAIYSRLFGNPFAYTVDPLWPPELVQPPLRLPWAKEESWYFTGGPHGGWASGAAWAALDFAPPEDDLGVCQSDNWVTAMADGLVTRSDFGAVVVDGDGDGYAGTGWAITYMHLETRDRVTTGTLVQSGDRLGHPSCEGGFSNAKHVHVARLYNGRWVAADGPIPFEMSGWLSVGLGREYDGQLVRGGVIKEACDGCREESSMITAD